MSTDIEETGVLEDTQLMQEPEVPVAESEPELIGEAPDIDVKKDKKEIKKWVFSVQAMGKGENKKSRKYPALKIRANDEASAASAYYKHLGINPSSHTHVVQCLDRDARRKHVEEYTTAKLKKRGYKTEEIRTLLKELPV